MSKLIIFLFALTLSLTFKPQAFAKEISQKVTYDLFDQVEFTACQNGLDLDEYRVQWNSLEKESIDELSSYKCYVGRLTIKNTGDQKAWILRTGTHLLDRIDLMVFSEDEASRLKNGRNIPADQRAIKHTIYSDFPLSLDKDREYEILFKFNFYIDVLDTKNIRMNLIPQDEFWENTIFDHTYIVFILGAYFILVFSALALFVSSREMLYLYYALYIGIGAIFVTAYDGFLEEYLLGQSAYTFKYFWLLGCAAPTIYLLFMRSFLALSFNNRRFDFIVRVVIALSVLALIASLILSATGRHFDDGSYVIHFMILAQMGFMLISQFVLMPRILKDFRVRFFVVGSFFYLITSFYYEFQGFGTSKGIATGALFEGLIFAAGMGYRLYRNGKNRRLELEKEVAQRTAELQEKNNRIREEVDKNKALVRETHHRVKNNLQSILSLVNLQKRRISGDESTATLEQIQSRINSISLVHQQLNSQQDLSTLNLKEYCKELLKVMKENYIHMEGFECEMNCEIEDLDLENVISVGVIFNELITNTIKHALADTGTLKVKFSVNKDGDFISIHYSDNGSKKQDRLKEGLGYSIIRSFISSEGKFDYNLEDNGFRAEIAIPLHSSQEKMA